MRHNIRSIRGVSRTRRITASLISLVCLLGIVALDRLEPFAYVNLRSLLRDGISRAGRTTEPNPDMVFLAIDSDSVGIEEGADIENLYGLTDGNSTEARSLRLMTKHWPWPREVYALLLDRLVGAGAKVVLFDLTFPTSTEDDEAFRLALEKYREHVVIGSNFIASASRGYTTIGASHTRPPESLVPQTVPMDDRVGYTNFWPDEDDVVRQAQYRVTFEQVRGELPATGAEQFLSLDARGLSKAGFGARVPDGLSPQIFRFTGPPRVGFRPHSVFEIFVPDYWEQNYDGGKFFRNKIVMVGAEGNWQHDEHATPWGVMPGPELHLNAMNAALRGEFIGEMSHDAVALAALGTALLAVALSLGVRSPWLRLVSLLALDALDLWATLLAYNHLSLYIPCLPLLLQFNSTVLLGLVSDFTFERLEKHRVRRALERYVSTNVVHELLDSPRIFQESLGGVMKPAAILFSDIRGYSLVSAKLDPQTLVAQLNEYLSAMVDCVFRHGGTLDKFIGDAVMAVWGNAKSAGARADTINAVRAALDMRTELDRLNRRWQQRGLPELRIGMAINQGDVVVGNIGSAQRMEFTVIGDAVNVSWRLQELTKKLGANLLVSASVAALVVEEFELQSLGQAQIQGQGQEIEVYAVLSRIEVDSSGETASVTA